MRVKKVNIFNDIKHENLNSIENFFFDFQKFEIVSRFFRGLNTYKNNIERARISRWIGRENEENEARTRNCWCGWPSCPR